MTIEHTVRAGDGLALFVREWPAEAPAQGATDMGAPVLCLHGLTRNSRDFEVVAPRLAALGRRVLAMDVRGRGRSDWDPQPSRYAAPVYVQDALKALDDLGVERAIWLGTSMGGIIAMIAAGAAPQRVAGAILNDIGAVIDAAGLRRIASYVGRGGPVADWPAAAGAVRALNGAAFPQADDAFWLTTARRTFRQRADGRVEPDYDPAIAGPPPAADAPSSVDLWPAFAALDRIPTLVLRGALSDILTRDVVLAMRERKPDLAWAEVHAVGHAPTLEEPAAWLPIVDFLAQTP
jgi:pimeloyl-ACP methyl ester carboxylesterase